MIKITIYKNKEGQYKGLRSIGHAGFAAFGKDIVCAGASALVINTLNSIEAFTDTKFSTKSAAKRGEMLVRFDQPADHDTKLLMDSLVLGLQGIQKNYGVKYITLNFKEV